MTVSLLNHSALYLAALPFAAVLATGTAHAQDGEDAGIYVTAKAGAEFLNDSRFVGIQAPAGGVPGIAGAPAVVDVDYDTGFSINGAIGYNFDDNLFFDFLASRVELELGYIEADVGGGAFNGGNQLFSGDISNFTATIGVYNDIVISENQKLFPYFGSSIGIAVVDANVLYFPDNGVATAPTFGVFGEETAFVSRSTVGLRYDFSDNIGLFLEGRYTKVEDGDFERRFVADGSGGFSASVRDDTESFGVGAGLLFRF
ncbi:MAG: P44/Msp2 family outer membrane protein [Pseudomonadota bacterium]